MIRFFIFTLLFVVAGQVCLAQENIYQLRGVITTSEREALPAATITLQDSIQKNVIGAVSDANGRYALKLHKAGRYLVKIRCVGYKTLLKSITVTQSYTEQDFILEENTEELSEVVVIAKHTKLKPNGNIRVQFKGNPMSKGKSMGEALRFVPSIEVIGDNLLINGKEDNLIYIGDQVITLQQLNTIPASMIDHIEVIPNPSVSFGKGVKGGIIMVTLRAQEGILGSTTLPLQFDRLGLVEVMPMLFLQYQKGDVTFYNTLRGGLGRYTTKYERQDRYEASSSSLAKTIIDSKTRDYAVMDNLGVQYQINKQQRLGFFGGVVYDIPQVTTKNTNAQMQNILTQGYNQQSLNVSGGLSYNAHLNICEGMNISSTISYSHSQNNLANYYTSTKDNTAFSNNRTRYFVVNPKASLSFVNGHLLTGGITYAYAFDQNNTDGISDSSLKQLTEKKFIISGFDFAPFIEYSKMFGKRIYLQAGISYQTTVMQYRDLLHQNQDYKVPNHGLYPKMLLQYMINPNQASGIALVYRHFFSLPNYGYYSPIATYHTENLYSIGNQKLKQETFDEMELNYYLNRDWNFTYRLCYGRDIIQIMTYPDESAPNLFYTQPNNIGTQWHHYASASFNKHLFSFWHTNNLLYLRHDREQMPQRSVQSLSIGGTSTHQLALSKSTGVTIAFSGQSAQQKLGYTLGAQFALDAGCYTSLLRDQLQLSLSLNNILHSQNTLTTRIGNSELIRFDLSPRTRLKLSITYTFSSGDKVDRVRGEKASTLSQEKPIL